VGQAKSTRLTAPAPVRACSQTSQAIRDALAAIETQLAASLPQEYHLVGIALKVLRVSARRDVAEAVPTDEAESAHADLCTQMNKHTHQHCATCLKTAKGRSKE